MQHKKVVKMNTRVCRGVIVSISINLHIQFKLSNVPLSDKITTHSPLSPLSPVADTARSKID